MRRRNFWTILLLLLLAPAGWTEEGVERTDGEDFLQQIDGLLERGTAENYRTEGLDVIKESLDVCLDCMKESPGAYEILWRCARSAHHYGETARNLQVPGWEEICKEWGKKGMDFAGRAQGIEPDRVEGYFWEAACVGVYSDGTGIMTAVKEGFYKKSKNAMARAYDVDKSYNDYDPVFGSAMFWISLPFPLKNRKKALAYYREFEENTTWTLRPYVRRIYGANLLMEVEPKGYKEEAIGLLEKALTAPHLQKYYRDWAEGLQAELK